MKDSIKIELRKDSVNRLAEIMLHASRTCGEDESMEDLMQLPVVTLQARMSGAVEALIMMHHPDRIAGTDLLPRAAGLPPTVAP